MKNKLSLMIIISCCLQIASAQNKIPENDKYFGQKPPGMVAVVFAPDIISTKANEHSPLSFSPDGTTVLWAIMDTNFRGRLLEMNFKNGFWTKPSNPSFADTTADDYCPSFSTDGTLYFSSRRKAPDGYPQGRGNRIWKVSKTNSGWGAPIPFDTTISKSREFSHSIANNKNFYFTAPSDGKKDMNIYQAQWYKQSYSRPVPLPFGINSIGYEDGAYIAPDESYLIFESTRPEGNDGSHDLYISFKNKKGEWGIPLNMGPEINSGSMERFPRVSPDGKYLFFASNRDKSNGKVGYDYYWIDAGIIEIIRKQSAKAGNIQQPLANEILTALDKNNFDAASILLAQWLMLHPTQADATIIYSTVLRKLKRFAESETILKTNEAVWKSDAGFSIEFALVKFGLNQDDEAQKIAEPFLSLGNMLRNRLTYLADELFSLSKYSLSDNYFERAFSINPNNTAHYNRACAYALIGNKDKAFELLNKAIEKGYNSKADFDNDADLTPLKQDARWSELLTKLKYP